MPQTKNLRNSCYDETGDKRETFQQECCPEGGWEGFQEASGKLLGEEDEEDESEYWERALLTKAGCRGQRL